MSVLTIAQRRAGLKFKRSHANPNSGRQTERREMLGSFADLDGFGTPTHDEAEFVDWDMALARAFSASFYR